MSNCPECDIKLIFEMGFTDCFNPISGHYTIDAPLMVCPNCDYSEDYDREREDFEE